MSSDLKSTSPQIKSSAANSAAIAVSGLSSDALARRRVLLKGLGKGSAVLAAVAVPMHSLAAESVTTDGRKCSISGSQSGVHSGTPITAVCTGYKPSYYSTLANWPNYASQGNNAQNSVATSRGTVNFDKNTQFNTVFGNGSNDHLLSILGSNPPSTEAHWVAALLNAIASASKGLNYPYSPSEVVAFYQGSQASSAYNFFKNFMETLA